MTGHATVAMCLLTFRDGIVRKFILIQGLLSLTCGSVRTSKYLIRAEKVRQFGKLAGMQGF